MNTHTQKRRATEVDTPLPAVAQGGRAPGFDVTEVTSGYVLPPLSSIEATQLGLVRMYGFLGAYMARYPKERQAEHVVTVVHQCDNCHHCSHPVVEFERGADPVVRLLEDNCPACGVSLDRYEVIADIIATATKLRLDIQRGVI